MGNRLLIDSAYCDRIGLKTGETVCVRLVRPADKEKMLQAFAELSESSRHKRFFGAKRALSESDLRYFTETDEWDHFALVAVSLDANKRETSGLGVARCIRVPDDPTCAEVAVTVIDRMQGNGIGRLLLERLISAASERGITRFRFECLAHNRAMQQLVKKLFHLAHWHRDGQTVVVETDISQQLPATVDSTKPARRFNFYALFRSMAMGSVDLQMSLSRCAIQRGMRASLIGTELLRRAKFPASIRKD